MKIVPKSDRLVILLDGMERFWALKVSIVIKATDITEVDWNDDLPERSVFESLRFPGTSVPSVFYAGSYYHKNDWRFLYLHMRRPGELTITTRLRKYHVFRLSTDETTAFLVQEWFNRLKRVRKSSKGTY